MKIFLSSILGPNSESLDHAEFVRLAGLCKTKTIEFVLTPEEADIILLLITGAANVYEGLRRNRVWKKWPEKSFVYYEGDYPGRFLHGLQTSAHKSWSASGRFQACAYPLHQLIYPNPCPPLSEMALGKKDLLFSFAGRASHRVRKKLFAMIFPPDEVIVKNTSASYYHFNNKAENREEACKRYWDLARRSKYALCPRGFGISSVRLFEMLEAGIAPVIIADGWLPPWGPKWEDFALFVPENEIGSVYEQVKAHETEYLERGRLARKAWEQYFSPENYWSFLLESLHQIQKKQKLEERFYLKLVPLMAAHEWVRKNRIHAVIWLKTEVKGLLKKFSRDAT